MLSLALYLSSAAKLQLGGDSSPKESTHPLNCVTVAVVYLVNASIFMEVGMEDYMEFYMNSTSTGGPGENFLMAVMEDLGRRAGAE